MTWRQFLLRLADGNQTIRAWLSRQEGFTLSCVPLCYKSKTLDPTAQPITKNSIHGHWSRRQRARRWRRGNGYPVRDPELGPRHAGAGVRHGLAKQAGGPGGHHRARRPPRLPPPGHGIHVPHGADGGRRRSRVRPRRRRALPRRPLRHLQALDLRRAPGPRRPGAPRVPRPPRPRLPRPLPCPLARRRHHGRRPRGQGHAGGVRHGGRVAWHGGVPPAGPGEVRRGEQLLSGEDGEAASSHRRAAGGQPGGVERRLEAGEGAGGVRPARRRRGRLLAARRVRRLLGFRRRHGERRLARSRRRQRQDGRAGGVEVAIRAGCVMCAWWRGAITMRG